MKPGKPLTRSSPLERKTGPKAKPHALTQRQPRRLWADARAKVDREGECRLIRFRDGPLQGQTVMASGAVLAGLGGWPLPQTLGVNDESGAPVFAPIDDSEHGHLAAREASYAYSKVSESKIPDVQTKRTAGVIRGAEYALDRMSDKYGKREESAR